MYEVIVNGQGLVKCPDNKLTGMAFNFHSLGHQCVNLRYTT